MAQPMLRPVMMLPVTVCGAWVRIAPQDRAVHIRLACRKTGSWLPLEQTERGKNGGSGTDGADLSAVRGKFLNLGGQRSAGCEIRRARHAARQHQSVQRVKIELVKDGVREHCHLMGGSDLAVVCDGHGGHGNARAAKQVNDGERLHFLKSVREKKGEAGESCCCIHRKILLDSSFCHHVHYRMPGLGKE